MRRRALLAGSAASVVVVAAQAATFSGAAPWRPYAGDPPPAVSPAGWLFFSPEEAAAVEALVDRIVPPDDTPGGREAGCAVFIDRQLAGPYGNAASQYMRPPFMEGTKEQGIQSPITPAQRYRLALAALDAHCTAAFAGKRFPQLTADQQDKIIGGLENASVSLQSTSGRAFFEMLLKDTQNGYLGDPTYGGNKDMVSWKLIGFPGARYDYRDYIDKHNVPFPLPPLSIRGRPAWDGTNSETKR